MPLTQATQILIDGPRNTVAKTTGDALQSDLPQSFTVLDPSLLTDMNPGMSGSHLATLLRIDYLEYSLSDGVTAQFKWDATTPVLIAEVAGRGKFEPWKYGGWQNNAGAGITGKITVTLILADQATSSNNVTFTWVMKTIKFRPISVGGA